MIDKFRAKAFIQLYLIAQNSTIILKPQFLETVIFRNPSFSLNGFFCQGLMEIDQIDVPRSSFSGGKSSSVTSNLLREGLHRPLKAIVQFSGFEESGVGGLPITSLSVCN